MGGGWRRPVRPFQVSCVVAVGLPTAAISRKFAATECAGPRLSAGSLLAALGERLNAKTTDPGIGRNTGRQNSALRFSAFRHPMTEASVGVLCTSEIESNGRLS